MLAQYYNILKDLIAYKSISPDTQYISEMNLTASYLQKLFHEHTWDAEVIANYGNPIVLASYVVDSSLPTCLLYGHYDVQPADKDEWWKHDPFSLYLGKDKIYGRGVADDKWQFLIHLLTIFDLAKQKKLAYNIIWILEWEEEIGSAWLTAFLTDYKDKLKADFALISDSSIIGDYPCIDVGYRWSCNVKLTLNTAATDAHSWSYGGVIPNAIHEASTLLSKLFDDKNRITIPYFYYNVEEITADVLVKHRKIKVDLEKVKLDLGVKTILVDKEYDYLTQIGLRPTIQVTWIHSGHVGDGFKNAIPATATIHLNFRLVKNQHIEDVVKGFEQWLSTTIPDYVEYKVQVADRAEAAKVSLQGKYIKKAERILKELFGKNVFYQYSWWTLPIVNLFADMLGTENLLIPLSNEDCNIHGVNENMDIALIERGFEFSRNFFTS